MKQSLIALSIFTSVTLLGAYFLSKTTVDTYAINYTDGPINVSLPLPLKAFNQQKEGYTILCTECYTRFKYDVNHKVYDPHHCNDIIFCPKCKYPVAISI